jgi:hypothetical protein
MQLPFKSSPIPETVLIGTEETGVLEIRKLGDLSPLERIYISEQFEQFPNIQREAIAAAREVVKRSPNIPLIEAFNALLTGDQVLLIENLEILIDFQKLSAQVTEQRNLIRATAILKCRVDPNWDLEHTRDANLIHPKLVALLADFLWNEQTGWAPPELITSETDLGESKPSQNRLKRTGQGFTTESKKASRTSKNSTQNGSVTSQSG